MIQADVDALRPQELSDEAVHIAVQIIAYFNCINRVADALGVEPEAERTPYRDNGRNERRSGRGTGARMQAVDH